MPIAMARNVLPQIVVTATNASQGLGNVLVGLSIGRPYRIRAARTVFW